MTPSTRPARTPGCTSGRPPPRSATTSGGSSTSTSCRPVRCASSACPTTSATTRASTGSCRASPARKTTVRVRRRVVDATYLETPVPSTHTPSFRRRSGRAADSRQRARRRRRARHGLHDHRRGQDRDRRLPLAARQRCRAGCDPLDQTARRLASRPPAATAARPRDVAHRGRGARPRGLGRRATTSTTSSAGSRRRGSSSGSIRPSSPRCTGAPP